MGKSVLKPHKGIIDLPQLKSEQWSGMFVDLVPGVEIQSGSILRAHVENPPEPMVSVFASVFGSLSMTSISGLLLHVSV